MHTAEVVSTPKNIWCVWTTFSASLYFRNCKVAVISELSEWWGWLLSVRLSVCSTTCVRPICRIYTWWIICSFCLCSYSKCYRDFDLDKYSAGRTRILKLFFVSLRICRSYFSVNTPTWTNTLLIYHLDESSAFRASSCSWFDCWEGLGDPANSWEQQSSMLLFSFVFLSANFVVVG